MRGLDIREAGCECADCTSLTAVGRIEGAVACQTALMSTISAAALRSLRSSIHSAVCLTTGP
jgi:hypothetical protein